MKHIKFWLTTIATLLCSLAASAHNFEVGGIYYNITSSTDQTVEVTYQGSYGSEYSNEYTGAVTIPSTVTYNYKTYQVTSIGSEAFYKCNNLTSITIPESVTEIGNYVFSNCSSLTSIIIPESVTAIGYYVFRDCSSLTSIVVAEGNTVYDSRDNCNAIIDKENNSLIVGCSTTIIPENVTSIGEYAFYVCSGLTSINIPKSVTSIGNGAFSECSSLTSIIIPESVTEIGNYAFEGCISLKEVIIEDGNTILLLGYNYSYDAGEGLFYDCPLETVYLGRNLSYSSGYSYGYSPFYNGNRFPTFSFGEGLTKMPDYFFYNNTTLSSLTIPESVTEIGASAFSNCSSLSSITLPEGMTSIGYQAFYGCNSLTTIMLPESVTSIGNMAFSNCSSLTTINIPEDVTEIGASAFYDTPWYNNQNQFDGVVYINNILYEYKGTMPWNTSIDVKEGTVSISPHAFDYCSNLTAITIPEGVTSIGARAFQYCRLLTSINIPASVTSIGDEAFYDCRSLTAIVVAEGNTVYDSRDNCNAIIEKENNRLIVGCSTTTIPDGVTSIGDYAFCGCRLTSIILPEGVTEIGEYAFKGCSLTSITLPKSVTTFGNYAFSDCTGELVVNCNIPYVSSSEYHKSAFYGSEFTKVTIGKDVKEIGSGAFYNCSSITSILCKSSTPPDCGFDAFKGVDKSIPVYVPYAYSYQSASGWSAFTNLRSVSIGTCGDNLTWHLTNEGELVISGTGAMRDYESNYDIPWYDNKASITKLVIEDGVTALGKRAFRDCSNLTSIICKAKTPPTCYTNTFTGVDKSIPLHVPEASIAAYQSAETWKNFTMVEPLILASGTCGETLTWYLTDGGELVISGTGAMTDFASYSNEAPWNEFSEAIVKITIGEGVTSIGNYAFYGDFSRLISITIPESLTKIGYSAFYMTNYNSLLTAVYISSIEAWYKFSFDGGPYSNPLNYAHNLYLNGELVTELAVPEGVTSIGICAFVGCYSLTDVTLPESVTSIGYAAFMGCINLTSINIPEGVTSIEGGTFLSCGSLTSINIPESVTSIGDHAFAYCNGLSDIYYYAEELPTIHSDAFYDVDIDEIILHVPADAVEAYKASAPWYDFYDVVPIEPLVADVVVNDPYSEDIFVIEEGKENVNITYIRNFEDTNWQSLYVPFEIPYDTIKNDFWVAYINDVHQFDDDKDGAIDRAQVEAVKMEGGVLKANYPYLIRAKEVGEKVITVPNTTLYATEENSIGCSSVFDSYTFKGTYSKMSSSELPKEEGYYVLNGGVWESLSADASLGAFRIYMKIDSRDASAAIADRVVEMRVVGDDEESTGVEALDETINSKLPATICDLHGRRVADTENLKGGIYIVNGKKVVK